ncbi:MAG: hypothetical protein J4F36_08680 [Nitrosopumilaceae archaeon]|nr:hypothetical protein [Nitrosopumilaceae archaeon]
MNSTKIIVVAVIISSVMSMYLASIFYQQLERNWEYAQISDEIWLEMVENDEIVVAFYEKHPNATITQTLKLDTMEIRFEEGSVILSAVKTRDNGFVFLYTCYKNDKDFWSYEIRNDVYFRDCN